MTSPDGRRGFASDTGMVANQPNPAQQGAGFGQGSSGQQSPAGSGSSSAAGSEPDPAGGGPQYDDSGGQDGAVFYTAEHTYGRDVTGDHLVRVVSPVGVYAEFVGTPGAELVILTPPHQAYVPPQGKLKLQAHIKYADPDMEPRQVTAQAEWTSSRRNVATVGTKTGATKGVVTGRNNGTTTITATYGGLKATRKIETREASGRTLSIDSPSGENRVAKGKRLPLRSTVTLTDGKTQAVTNKTTWSSSNEQVATVSRSGEVTGVSGGTVEITGQYKNQEGRQLMAKLKVTVEAELDGQKTEENGSDQTAPEAPEAPETKPGNDSGSETGNESGSDDSTNPSEDTGATDPSQGGAQDPSQGGATDPSAGGAQDPSQGSAGGVEPQYQQ